MATMNPAIKTMWLAALRSGEYPQARQRLHDKTGYCCLGVLCDLHAKATGGWWKPRRGEKDQYVYLENPHTLPPAVAAWAGLDELNPEIRIDGEITNLASANDSGATFPEIAAAIEAQY